jgi:hypothetical protein
MGSPEALDFVIESYAATVVVFHEEKTAMKFVFALNEALSVQMRDKLMSIVAEPVPKKPVTAGERYLMSKSKGLGMTFNFDDDIGAIHVADRAASPTDLGLGPDVRGTLSFKSRGLDGVACVPFVGEELEAFAQTLSEILELRAKRN